MHEEPFGPLALVNRVRTLDEAIEKANAVPYGLAGALTNSAHKADRLAESIEVGNLSINHFVASAPKRHSAASRTAASAAKVASTGCNAIRS